MSAQIHADNNADSEGLLGQSVESRAYATGRSCMLRTALSYGRGTDLMPAHVDWDNQEHAGPAAAGMDAALFEIVRFRVPVPMALMQEALGCDNRGTCTHVGP